MPYKTVTTFEQSECPFSYGDREVDEETMKDLGRFLYEHFGYILMRRFSEVSGEEWVVMEFYTETDDDMECCSYD